MASDVNEPSHWNVRYEENNTPWDRGEPALALTRLLDRLAQQNLRVLVPGAGYGQDALGWARAGHRPLAVDFAPKAVEGARALAAREGLQVEVIQADIFALPSDMHGAFDAVWEQTCLCAIDPGRREDYVEAMAQVLRPQGMLYALLWNHGNEGGPPYDLPPEPTKALLGKRFELIEERDVPGSSRKGEYLLEMRKA